MSSSEELQKSFLGEHLKTTRRTPTNKENKLEENKTPEGQEVDQKPEIDLEALMSRVEQLESSKNRLLEESKEWKGKYQGLKQNVEKETESKLAENEQWKELLELERNKVHELSSKVKNLSTATMQKDLQFKVASLAKDAYNVDDVITSIAKTGMLKKDEETGSISGIEEAYNTVREQKPYLFNTAKKSGMDTGKPNEMLPKEKSIDERIQENPNDILGEVLKDLL